MTQIKKMIKIGGAAAIGSVAATSLFAQGFEGAFAGIDLSTGQGPLFDGQADFGSVVYDISGGSVGVFAGYNWASGPWVYGADATLSLGQSVEGSEDYQDFYGALSMNYMADVRLRAGYTLGDALIYGAVGFSLAELDYDNGGYLAQGRGTNIGVGFEYNLSGMGQSGLGDLFVGADYTMRDMDETDYVGPWEFSTTSIRVGMHF
ncbi:MAG: outer membrane protein [Yoonia sp.]